MKPPLQLELFIKLMKMTTSNTDGEALAAIRMANGALARSGGDWEELLRGKLAPVDPFASLPEPQVKPTPQSTPSHSSTWNPAPTPPPPPRFYGKDPKEAKDISTWLTTCEFAPLSPSAQRTFNHIEARWTTNKQLDSTDYANLQAMAKQVKKGRRP